MVLACKASVSSFCQSCRWHGCGWSVSISDQTRELREILDAEHDVVWIAIRGLDTVCIDPKVWVGHRHRSVDSHFVELLGLNHVHTQQVVSETSTELQVDKYLRQERVDEVRID